MSEVNAFRFPRVSKKLPKHVIENLVDKWCSRDGAIRYIDLNEFLCKVYVDVAHWLPAGYEMRDKLAVLKQMGTYEKNDIPVHNLKFGRYLLVCPSYTLAEHEAYVQRLEVEAVQPPVQPPVQPTTPVQFNPFQETTPTQYGFFQPAYFGPYGGQIYYGIAPYNVVPHEVLDTTDSDSSTDVD
jgi:hypothetical protein